MPQLEIPLQQGDATFQQSLQPVLQQIEAFREEKNRIYIGRASIGKILTLISLVPLCLSYYFFLFRVGVYNVEPVLIFGLFLWGGIFFWVGMPLNEYQDSYKENVMPMIARSLGLDEYKLKGEIPISEMSTARILPGYETYSSSDYFAGHRKETGLRFAQATFEERKGFGKYSHLEIVFQGVVLMIDLQQPKFFGHTILFKQSGMIGDWVQTAGTDLQRVGLEDPKFSGEYGVFSNDQVEARYILDPLMMEKILNLYEIYAASSLTMSFMGAQVFVMVNCERSLFDPPPIEMTATNCAFAESLKGEVSHIMALMDYLDLYKPPAVGSG